jgi:predicted CXXCH cytochrome family protein
MINKPSRLKMTRVISIAIVLVMLSAGTAFCSEFELLVPALDSFFGDGKVLIIGKLKAVGPIRKVEVFDNGKTLGFAPVKNRTFIFEAQLPEGKHELVLASPGVKRLTFTVLVGKQEGYVYHIEPEMSSCSGCHEGSSKGEYKVSLEQGGICYECHDNKAEFEFVHGPVAADSCSPCHDPHGSRYENFLRTTGKELCLVCHSQNMSRAHIEDRKNRDCVSCHDPHSSGKEFHLK